MYELRVLSGLHQGTALPLIGEQWSIGADEEADLALFEPGLEDGALTLQRVEESWVLNVSHSKPRSRPSLPISG